MDKKADFQPNGQMIFGMIVIGLGVLLLLGNLFDFDIGAFFWPLLLIGAGVWLLVRPKMMSGETAVTQRLLGEIDRTGNWAVQNEEFQSFIADTTLDLTKADIPKGLTHFRFLNFVGDIELFVPEGVGVSISSSAFVSEISINGSKEESIFGGLHRQTENYDHAAKQIKVDASGFVNEIKVRVI
jgi:predicted membrane protein